MSGYCLGRRFAHAWFDAAGAAGKNDRWAERLAVTNVSRSGKGEEDVQVAVGLFQQYSPQGVRSRDIVHAAVMQNNRLTEIISTDIHFDLIQGLTRLDPLTLYQNASRNHAVTALCE